MPSCFVCSADATLSTYDYALATYGRIPVVHACMDCALDLGKFLAEATSAELVAIWYVPAIDGPYLEAISADDARGFADLGVAWVGGGVWVDALAAAGSAMRSGTRDPAILRACLHVIVESIVSPVAELHLTDILRARKAANRP